MRFYHTTSKTVLPSILKEGLRAQVPEDHLWQPRAVYLWSSRADAERMTRHGFKRGMGCVVTIDLPDDHKVFKDDGLCSDDDCTAVLYLHDIAPKFILGVF